jgi:pimeloyl-ACP methyl ester carboxylesterase
LLVNEEPIVLITNTGNIDGTLRVPLSKKPIPVTIIIAGSGPTDRDGNQPTMRNNSLKMLSEALFYNNIASLTFDKRGIAGSKQSYQNESDLRFEHYIEDVKQWIDLLKADKRFSDIIVLGHSEGSLIGMVAAQSNSSVSKYISVAGVGEPAANILKEQLEKQLAGQPQATQDIIFSYIDKLEKGETIENVPPSLNSLFRPSVQPYMISWFKYDPKKEISKLKIPILIIQGTTDLQVSVNQAELLYEAAPSSEKIVIENMNHILKDCVDTSMQTQISTTYNNIHTPINKELIEAITNFIKKQRK